MDDNGTTSGGGTGLVFPLWKATIIATFICIMIIITVAGNFVVILAFFRDNTLRMFTDYFIINLAIADFIIGTICIPLYVPYLLTGKWFLGVFVCKMWLTLDYVTPATSTLNMCVITIDRYIQLTKPLEYRAKQTTKLRLIMTMTPWLVAVLLYMPAINMWELWTGNHPVPEGACYVPFYDNMAFLSLSVVIEFLIPFVVVLTFNMLVFLNIRKRTKRDVERKTHSAFTVSTMTTERSEVASTSIVAETSQQPEAQTSSHVVSQRKMQSEKIAKDRRAAKSLFILVFVFGMCWMPYEVVASIQCVCSTCVNPSVFEAFFWMLWLNSTINPFLYPLLHRRYKLAFRRLFKCLPNRIISLAT